jgi:hypothetical protein
MNDVWNTWLTLEPDTYLTKNDICRFMHATKFNYEKTVAVLKERRKWRKDHRMDTVNYYRDHKNPAYNVFKGEKWFTFLGADKFGRPVVLMSIGRCLPDKEYPSAPHS